MTFTDLLSPNCFCDMVTTWGFFMTSLMHKRSKGACPIPTRAHYGETGNHEPGVAQNTRSQWVTKSRMTTNLSSIIKMIAGSGIRTHKLWKKINQLDHRRSQSTTELLSRAGTWSWEKPRRILVIILCTLKMNIQSISCYFLLLGHPDGDVLLPVFITTNQFIEINEWEGWSEWLIL